MIFASHISEKYKVLRTSTAVANRGDEYHTVMSFIEEMNVLTGKKRSREYESDEAGENSEYDLSNIEGELDGRISPLPEDAEQQNADHGNVERTSVHARNNEE